MGGQNQRARQQAGTRYPPPQHSEHFDSLGKILRFVRSTILRFAGENVPRFAGRKFLRFARRNILRFAWRNQEPIFWQEKARRAQDRIREEEAQRNAFKTPEA